MAQSAPSWLTNLRRWLRVAAHEVRALKQAAGMTPTEWQSRREAFVNNALASGVARLRRRILHDPPDPQSASYETHSRTRVGG